MLQSLQLQEDGRQRIPGMTQLLSKRPDMFSIGVWPGYYSKAKGATVWDLDGKEYLDMSMGASALAFWAMLTTKWMMPYYGPSATDGMLS